MTRTSPWPLNINFDILPEWQLTYILYFILFHFIDFLWKNPFLFEHTILIFSKQYRELESLVFFRTIRVECY